MTRPTGLAYFYSAIRGLVGYWPFDELAAGFAPDLSGNAGHARVHGATLADGILGKALSFSGAGDYVTIEDSGSLADLTGKSFTFSVWAYPQSVPSNRFGYGIVLRSARHPSYVFGISYLPDERYRAQVLDISESVIRVATDSVRPGAWHHLVMAVDYDAMLLHLYLDGEPVAGSPKRYTRALLDLSDSESETVSAGWFYIGSAKPDRGAGPFFTRHLHGLVDEVRIYDRMLSHAEIRNLLETGTREDLRPSTRSLRDQPR